MTSLKVAILNFFFHDLPKILSCLQIWMFAKFNPRIPSYFANKDLLIIYIVYLKGLNKNFLKMHYCMLCSSWRIWIRKIDKDRHRFYEPTKFFKTNEIVLERCCPSENVTTDIAKNYLKLLKIVCIVLICQTVNKIFLNSLFEQTLKNVVFYGTNEFFERTLKKTIVRSINQLVTIGKVKFAELPC